MNSVAVDHVADDLAAIVDAECTARDEPGQHSEERRSTILKQDGLRTQLVRGKPDCLAPIIDTKSNALSAAGGYSQVEYGSIIEEHSVTWAIGRKRIANSLPT